MGTLPFGYKMHKTHIECGFYVRSGMDYIFMCIMLEHDLSLLLVQEKNPRSIRGICGTENTARHGRAVS